MVVPFPGSLWTKVVPPCASTMPFTIERPRPVPVDDSPLQ